MRRDEDLGQQSGNASDLIRVTMVELRGAISFVAQRSALPALLRACTTNPHTRDELLERADPYWHGLRDCVANGIAVFDEHNSVDNSTHIHAALRTLSARQTPVFRIVDDFTREASLRPVDAGCVVINLLARRIITLQDGTTTVTRNGRGEIFDGERNTGAIYVYRLPKTWSLVP